MKQANSPDLPPLDLETLHMGVKIIKQNFLRWRIPPVELPAESIMEKTVQELYTLFWHRSGKHP